MRYYDSGVAKVGGGWVNKEWSSGNLTLAFRLYINEKEFA